MSELHSLDTVIQVVPASTKAQGSAQRVVSIHPKTGKPPAGLIERGHAQMPSAATWRTYLVKTSADRFNVAQVSFRLELDDLVNFVTATIALQVSCEPTRVDEVAAALHDPKLSPLQKLELQAGAALSDVTNEGVPGLVRKSHQDRAKLSREFADALAMSTGLTVKADITVAATATAESLSFDEAGLMVRTIDSDREVAIRLRAQIDVNPGGLVNAVSKQARATDYQAEVRKQTVLFFRSAVKMHDLLDVNAVRARLKPALDQKLASNGRHVADLILEVQLPVAVTPLFTDTHSVSGHVPGVPEAVAVTARIRMVLTDYGKFVSAAPPSLPDWLAASLQRQVTKALFDAKHIDLVFRFDTVKESLRQGLTAEASAIGYNIEALDFSRDVPLMHLLEEFPLQIDDSFDLQFFRVPVRLKIDIKARIPTLEPIEDLLKKHANILDAMKDAMRDEVRSYLRTVSAERFYMRFKIAGADDETTVEEALKATIVAALRTKFHAEALSVSVADAASPIIDRLTTLQERIGKFSLETQSLQGGGTISWEGNFRVMGVTGGRWEDFIRSSTTLEIIAREIVRVISGPMQAVASEVVRYKNEAHRQDLEAQIAERATEHIATHFGLSITLMSLQRRRTSLEQAASDAQEKRGRITIEKSSDEFIDTARAELAISAGRVKQIEQLLTAQTDAIAAEGREPEVEDFAKRIRQIQGQMKPDHLPPADDIERLVLDDPGKGRAPSGVKSLNPRKQTPRLDEKK